MTPTKEVAEAARRAMTESPMMHYKPIAITGPMNHGKSTVAKMLAKYGAYRVVPFAQPMKDMLRVLGLTHDDLMDPELKETPHPTLCGKTPRQALQTLGTEWGRQTLGSDIWINAWRYSVEGSPLFGVIADDCRFINEARVIKQMGGEVWRVVDPRKEAPDGHLSEKEWMLMDADVEIKNNGDIEHLEAVVRTRWAERHGLPDNTSYVYAYSDLAGGAVLVRSPEPTQIGGIVLPNCS